MYEKISKDHNFKNTFLLTEKKLYSHWCIMEISKSSNSYISRVCNAIFFGYCVFRGQSKNLSFWAFYSTMSWIIKMPLFLDQFLFCFNLFFRRFFGRTEENAFTKNFRRFYKRRWEFHDDLRITFFCCESCIHMLGNARLVLLQCRLGERELIWFCNYKCEIFLRQKVVRRAKSIWSCGSIEKYDLDCENENVFDYFLTILRDLDGYMSSIYNWKALKWNFEI